MYQLVFWKKSICKPRMEVQKTFAAIEQNRDFETMTFFDSGQLIADLKQDFPELGEPESRLYTVELGRGERGNWLIFKSERTLAKKSVFRIVDIAVKNGLILYDPQQKYAWDGAMPLK